MSTRIASEDRSVEVTITPLGVRVTIFGHRWDWIVSPLHGSLSLKSTVEPISVAGDHLQGARRPEQCPGCRPFVEPDYLDALEAGASASLLLEREESRR